MVLACLAYAGCAAPERNDPGPSVDRSSPEATLRAFWTAIKAGDTNAAIALTAPERIAKGHGGRNLLQFIGEHRNTDTSTFRFLSGAGRCSIQSATHNMDYDMEKDEKGEWTIVSIHP
jgi:hypothetical protein